MTVITWDILALSGITISFLIVTLIYMLSYMFSNEFLKSWSREEFFNVFMTLILFGSIFSLVKLDLFANNINSADEYVGAVFSNVLNIQISIISDVSALSFISSLSFLLNPSMLTSSSKGNAGNEGGQGKLTDPLSVYISLAPFISPLITSLTSLQVYSFIPITMIKLHHLLIEFVNQDANRTFPILLALGVFLRAFKFSRNAGNTILAIFISLYFVLPVLYLFNQALVNVVLGEEELNKEIKLDEHENEGKGFVTELSGIIIGDIKKLSLSSALFPDDADDDSIGKTVYDYLSPAGKLYDFVIRFFIEGMILPYLSIIVALGLAREFALTLGSNVDFSSLVRLV